MTETLRSICRFCHAGCPILVDVEDGRAVRVRGDRDDPVYRGFTCEKGRQLPDQHAHPDRLLHPMRKRPDGTHERIDSATALDEIAAKLAAIVATWRPWKRAPSSSAADGWRLPSPSAMVVAP